MPPDSWTVRAPIPRQTGVLTSRSPRYCRRRLRGVHLAGNQQRGGHVVADRAWSHRACLSRTPAQLRRQHPPGRATDGVNHHQLGASFDAIAMPVAPTRLRLRAAGHGDDDVPAPPRGGDLCLRGTSQGPHQLSRPATATRDLAQRGQIAVRSSSTAIRPFKLRGRCRESLRVA